MSNVSETLLRQWTVLKNVPVHPQQITATELMGRVKGLGFEIGKRTIERDLQSLSALFPLIAEDKKRPYGWSWRRDADAYTLPAMSPVQALALCLARDHLTSLLPSGLLDALSPYFTSADKLLSNRESAKGMADWRKKIAIVPANQALIPPQYDEEIIETIHTALLSEKQLEIDYASRGQRKKTYPIHPLGLVQRGAVIYLVATMSTYEDIRILALHRIQRAEELEDPVRIPEDFSLDQFIAQGAFGFVVRAGEQDIQIEAVFDAEAAEHLRETPLSKDQEYIEEEGSVRIRATVSNTLQLRWWLMSFGEKVEVLGPDSLRKEFAETARAMRAAYKK